MYCKECGEEIIEGSSFCENCGAKIVSADPSFQSVQVNPVYPANSIYAANAAAAAIAAQQPQPVMQPQYVPAPVQPQYSAVPQQQLVPVQSQYVPGQTPAYMQSVAMPMYAAPQAPASGNKVFSLILRIASGVSAGIYTLAFLGMLFTDSLGSDAFLALFVLLSFSIFALVFSLCKKQLSKGAFLAMIIPLGVLFFLYLSVSGTLT